MRLTRWHLGASAALAACAVLGLAAAAGASSPQPTSISASSVVNNDGSVTVTVSGDWIWNADCSSVEGIGWAVDWQDPTLSTYPVTSTGSTSAVLELTTSFDGTDTHLCGSSSGTSLATGPWTASHTYANVSSVPNTPLCVNFYNLHGWQGSPSTNASDSLASGPGHDTDNSLENGDYTGANGVWCANVQTGVSVAPGLGSWALPAAGGMAVASVAGASVFINRRRRDQLWMPPADSAEGA